MSASVPAQGRPVRTGLGGLLFLGAMALGAGLALSSCAEEGFECGQLLPGTTNQYRSCTRRQEVCVCATGGCARRLLSAHDWDAVPRSELGLCKNSGLLYVESPFADPDLAGHCVDPAHATPAQPADAVLDEPDELRCPDAILPPPDSGPEPEPDAAPPPPRPGDAGDDAATTNDVEGDAS